MKMFVKSYTFPIAIFVMGVVAVIASNLEITERNQDLELILGGVLVCVGLLLWAVPELDRYLKRRDRMRQRSDRQQPRLVEANRQPLNRRR